MQKLFRQIYRQLYRQWRKRIYPKVEPFIATVGLFWLAVCFLLTYLLAKLSDNVLEREAFAFDKSILLWIHQFTNPVLDRVVLGITQMGNPKVVVPITLTVFVWLWWRKHRLEAKFFALDAFGGAVLSAGLKLAFSKPRPQLWPQLITETTYSYPSGHALGSMVLYGFLAYLLSSFFPTYLRPIYAGAIALIIAIGLSRLYLGVHWPTDIIGGYVIGFLWLFTCITLLRFQQSKSDTALDAEER